MTTPPNRTSRAPRTPPRGRDPRVARRPIPSQAVRVRRGPKPPDALIASLRSVLAAELATAGLRQDADPPPAPEPPRLGARWRSALRNAATRISQAARRGVLGALAGSAAAARAADVPDPDPGDWADRTTEAVQGSLGRTLRAGTLALLLEYAAGVLSAAVLEEHARQVMVIAQAAGVSRYVWTTQLDERVRHGHALLEASVQRWDRPPVTDPATGYRAHPGEPRNCRCQAFPIVR